MGGGLSWGVENFAGSWLAISKKQKCFNSATFLLRRHRSVSESVEACQAFVSSGITVASCWQPGGTSDTFIADFTVALKIPQLRVPCMNGADNFAKLSRLRAVEAQLEAVGTGTYVGKLWRTGILKQ